MTQHAPPVSPTRHIDRILEVIDRALGITDVEVPAPVYFDLPGRARDVDGGVGRAR